MRSIKSMLLTSPAAIVAVAGAQGRSFHSHGGAGRVREGLQHCRRHRLGPAGLRHVRAGDSCRTLARLSGRIGL